MELIQIHSVSIEAAKQLQQIGRDTFYETFAPHNTPENMAKYLEDSFAIPKLTAELKDPHTRFYFATLEGKIIGYLKINFGAAQTELQDDMSLEIERIYVLQQYHGKKVGQLLYDNAIAIAKEQKLQYVWLGVWENNERAIHFYKKNGFIPFDKHIFTLGDDVQTDIMMKLTLTG